MKTKFNVTLILVFLLSMLIVINYIKTKPTDLLPVYANVNVIEFGADPSGKKDSTKSIQKAINSIEKSGGVVFIPKGEYLITQIQLPSYVKLEGAGNNSVLRMKDNNNKPLIVLKSKMSQMVHLKNFMIDGNKKNQTSPNARGIEFINTFDGNIMITASKLSDQDARHKIENVIVFETKGDGLYIEGRGESKIENLQVFSSDSVGLFSNAHDNFFSNSSIGNSGLEGILIGYSSTNSHFTNCKSWYSGRLDSEKGDGFLILADRISLSSSEAQDNEKHGFVFVGNDNVGSALISESNGWRHSAKTPRSDGSGYVFLGAKNNNIQGVASDRFALTESKSHQSYAVMFLKNPIGNMVNITSKDMRMGASPNNYFEKNKVSIVENKSDGSVNLIQN